VSSDEPTRKPSLLSGLLKVLHGMSVVWEEAAPTDPEIRAAWFVAFGTEKPKPMAVQRVRSGFVEFYSEGRLIRREACGHVAIYAPPASPGTALSRALVQLLGLR